MTPSTPPDDDRKVIEQLDAGELQEASEEAEICVQYQNLIERIKGLAEIMPAPGWEERAEQRWHVCLAQGQMFMDYLQLVLEAEPQGDQMQHVELARELMDFLRRELAVPVTVHSAAQTDPTPCRDDIARGDPVAVAALILSIPSATLALHDLAARTKLKDCLHRVLVWVQERKAKARWRSSAEHIALPGDEERALDEVIDELVRTQGPIQID